MAAWAATSIRHRHRDTFLCWAVESRCEAVVDRRELCSRVIPFPRDRWKRKRWSPETWNEQVRLYISLRQLRFDFGIDLQGHSKTALLLRIANPRTRVAARATDGMARRLNPLAGTPPDGMHTVEWNHQVLRTFGDFDLPERPIMPCVEVERDPRLVTISVSAGQPAKAYPAEGWADVAAKLLAQGYRVAFLGGPTDAPIDVAGTESYVGSLPLDRTMGMVVGSRLHLAGDTGTGHMAAAYGVPVVSVFGPTDPAVYRPFTPHGVVLRESVRTADVSPQAVVSAALRLLEDGPALPH
jgi:ADP-heptose:LPS heptosyltransferase